MFTIFSVQPKSSEEGTRKGSGFKKNHGRDFAEFKPSLQTDRWKIVQNYTTASKTELQKFILKRRESTPASDS
jgi:hypothetical protein